MLDSGRLGCEALAWTATSPESQNVVTVADGTLGDYNAVGDRKQTVAMEGIRPGWLRPGYSGPTRRSASTTQYFESNPGSMSGSIRGSECPQPRILQRRRGLEDVTYRDACTWLMFLLDASQ